MSSRPGEPYLTTRPVGEVSTRPYEPRRAQYAAHSVARRMRKSPDRSHAQKVPSLRGLHAADRTPETRGKDARTAGVDEAADQWPKWMPLSEMNFPWSDLSSV